MDHATFDCDKCSDTGNASTGYQHPGFDALGCPLCNEEDGMRCCEARPDADGKCANCGHPIERPWIYQGDLAQGQRSRRV